MKALQCIELGGPDKLQVKDIADPVIAAEHVIIDLKAASINFPGRAYDSRVVSISTTFTIYSRG